MKISKQQFKSLIKECLVEILSEGLGGNLTESIARNGPPVPRRASTVQRRPVRDDVVQTPALANAIVEAAGNDDIMKEIFADTARTTLPTMLSERATPSPVGVEEQIVSKHDPSTIFSDETVDKWAALAFGQKK